MRSLPNRLNTLWRARGDPTNNNSILSKKFVTKKFDNGSFMDFSFFGFYDYDCSTTSSQIINE